jgi:hypothetical protein
MRTQMALGIIDGCSAKGACQGRRARCASARIHSLQGILADLPNAVFIDAPHVLLPADLAASFGPATDLSSLGAGEAEADGDAALRPRAWWKTNPERTMMIGVEDSLAALRDVLRKDRYEVG